VIHPDNVVLAVKANNQIEVGYHPDDEERVVGFTLGVRNDLRIVGEIYNQPALIAVKTQFPYDQNPLILTVNSQYKAADVVPYLFSKFAREGMVPKIVDEVNNTIYIGDGSF